jgi:hypothetical protein
VWSESFSTLATRPALVRVLRVYLILMMDTGNVTASNVHVELTAGMRSSGLISLLGSCTMSGEKSRKREFRERFNFQDGATYCGIIA